MTTLKVVLEQLLVVLVLKDINGNAHDGLVVDLNTSNLATLEDIELEITGVPYGVNRWRVLRSDVADCQLASGETDSDHGGPRFRRSR